MTTGALLPLAPAGLAHLLMRSTTSTDTSDREPSLLRRRGTAFVLALVAELLLILLFLTMAPSFMGKPKSSTLTGFDIAKGDEAPPAADKAESKTPPKAAAASKPAEASRPVPIVPLRPVVPPQPAEPAGPPAFVKLTRPDYAASDVSRMASRADDGAPAALAGSGSSAGDSEVMGKAPNGEPLYRAEWVREPTNAQLSPYIPARAAGRSGWGLVACRTISNYQVTDCQELGDGPRGSGYAGAVRQAAFQFRVRAPRKGGKLLVGTWVGIRVDYTISRSSRPSPAPDATPR